MISLKKVTLARGVKRLLEDASATINPGRKLGLVGANGCGKSTLFALMTGEHHLDAGSLEMPGGLTVARLAQEVDPTEASALNFVLDGDRVLRATEKEIEDAHESGDGHRIAAAHERMTEIDGFSAAPRAHSVLAGLGFAPGDAERPVSAFSGGWRMRLALAQVLLSRAQLLLLDEPTNHLDLDAILWLEAWLSRHDGTLLVISHDREFLDSVVDGVISFEGTTLREYTGNYTAFESARAEYLSNVQSAYRRQQEEIARMRGFIDRFKAKASKAPQAQSRMKALARMEKIAPAHVDSPFDFRFRDIPAAPDPLLALDHASAGYGGNAIISGVRVAIRPGERVGILGRNGAGKSTLVKLLAGTLQPMSGERREGKGLAIGYFAQHQVETLDETATPLEMITRLDRRQREQDLRSFLGGFGFPGDMATTPCGPFSGGERARLALALIVWQRPNLLLLDEPTNHLDLETREALTTALQDFEGAIVLVSHDRHLLRTTADELWLVAGGVVTDYDGDLEDYRKLSLERDRSARGPAGASRRDERREQAKAREAQGARRKELDKRLRALERDMARRNEERKAIETELADAEFYARTPPEQLQKRIRAAAEAASKVEQLESEWLEIQGELEALSAGA